MFVHGVQFLVFLAAGSNFSCTFGRGVDFILCFSPRGQNSRVQMTTGQIPRVCFAAGSHFSCVFGRGVKFLVCFWTRGQIYRVFWPRGQLSRVFWPRDQFSCVLFLAAGSNVSCALAAGSIFACMFGRGVKFPKKIIASDLGPRSKLSESVVGAAKSRPRDPKRAQESPKHANTRTPGRVFFLFLGWKRGTEKVPVFGPPEAHFPREGAGRVCCDSC